MRRFIATGALTAVAPTGCDKLTGDHITPIRVQGPDANPAHLEPGLWVAHPGNSEDGCVWHVHRNGYPIVARETYDAVPVYVWLPASTDTDDYGLATRGCTEWRKV